MSIDRVTQWEREVQEKSQRLAFILPQFVIGSEVLDLAEYRNRQFQLAGGLVPEVLGSHEMVFEHKLLTETVGLPEGMTINQITIIAKADDPDQQQFLLTKVSETFEELLVKGLGIVSIANTQEKFVLLSDFVNTHPIQSQTRVFGDGSLRLGEFQLPINEQFAGKLIRLPESETSNASTTKFDLLGTLLARITQHYPTEGISYSDFLKLAVGEMDKLNMYAMPEAMRKELTDSLRETRDVMRDLLQAKFWYELIDFAAARGLTLPELPTYASRAAKNLIAQLNNRDSDVKLLVSAINAFTNPAWYSWKEQSQVLMEYGSELRDYISVLAKLSSSIKNLDTDNALVNGVSNDKLLSLKSLADSVEARPYYSHLPSSIEARAGYVYLLDRYVISALEFNDSNKDKFVPHIMEQLRNSRLGNEITYLNNLTQGKQDLRYTFVIAADSPIPMSAIFFNPGSGLLGLRLFVGEYLPTPVSKEYLPYSLAFLRRYTKDLDLLTVSDFNF